jgi:CCR4-NOT transcription complex subunit 6
MLKTEAKLKMATPIVICGDFNAQPNSAVYELYTTGKLDGNHKELLKEPIGDLQVEFKLKSAYAGLGEPITNYTRDFKG